MLINTQSFLLLRLAVPAKKSTNFATFCKIVWFLWRRNQQFLAYSCQESLGWFLWWRNQKFFYFTYKWILTCLSGEQLLRGPIWYKCPLWWTSIQKKWFFFTEIWKWDLAERVHKGDHHHYIVDFWSPNWFIMFEVDLSQETT